MRNLAKCRNCKDIIESKHRHDFVWCGCRSIAVDGGQDYFKCCGDPFDFERLSREEQELLVLLDAEEINEIRRKAEAKKEE